MVQLLYNGKGADRHNSYGTTANTHSHVGRPFPLLKLFKVISAHCLHYLCEIHPVQGACSRLRHHCSTTYISFQELCINSIPNWPNLRHGRIYLWHGILTYTQVVNGSSVDLLHSSECYFWT